MGRPVIDLLNQTFGRWKVIDRDGFIGKNALWKCRCECGVIRSVPSGKLREGTSNSCGCLAIELVTKRATVHGFTPKGVKPSSEYVAWKSMKERCLKKYNHAYKSYGGRGIVICDRWLNSFENFINDMGYKPSEKHSLDRIDNNGNYEPNNCRWATLKEQNENRRSNIWIEFRGYKKILSEWCRLFGIPNNGRLNIMLKNKNFEEIFEYYEKKSGSNIRIPQ